MASPSAVGFSMSSRLRSSMDFGHTLNLFFVFYNKVRVSTVEVLLAHPLQPVPPAKRAD